MAENININVNVATNQAKASLEELTNSTKKFESAAVKAGKVSSNAFTSFVGFLAAGAVVKGLQLIRQAFSGVTDEIIDYDKAIREINTILPKNIKLTQDQVDALSDLSIQYGTSRTQQANSYYQIISAGITDTSKALDVLQASNALAQGGLASTETAILAITKVMNNFGDSAGTASDIADALFTGVRLGQTRMEEFGAELPKVLAISQSLGLGFRDTAAALTTLTNRSENTSVAATELSATLSSVLKNQAILSKTTDSTGRSFSIQRLETDGLSKYLRDLVSVSGNAANLQQLLGGRIQSLNGVLKLSADDFVSLNNNIDSFQKSTGAAQKSADEMALSLSVRLSKAFQVVKVAASDTASYFGGPMLTSLDAVGNFFGTIFKGVAQDIGIMDNGLGKSTNAILNYQKNISDLSGTIYQLKSSLKAVQENPEIAPSGRAEELKAQLQLAEDQLDYFIRTTKEKEVAAAVDRRARLDGEALADKERKQKLIADLNVIEADASLIKQEAENELYEANKAIEADRQKLALENLKKYTNEQGKLKSNLTNIEREEAKKQLDIVKKGADAEQKVKVQNFEASASLLNALSGLAALGGQKTFAITKALAMAAIPIDTAAGIMKAFATLPAPASNLQAAAIGITGATSLIKVASQKPPSFQNSGIVPGQPPIGGGDNTMANVSSGELILDIAKQNNIASQLTGSSQIVEIPLIIDGREIARVITDLKSKGYKI